GITRRTLAGDHAEIGHQLSRGFEAADVPDLDHERYRRNQTDTTQRLEPVNDRLERPISDCVFNRSLKAVDPVAALRLRMDHFMEDHSLPGVGEAERGQPFEV